jgi:hypothetical protein
MRFAAALAAATLAAAAVIVQACGDDDAAGPSAPDASPAGEELDGGDSPELSACRAYVTASCTRGAQCRGEPAPDPLCSKFAELCPEYLFAAGSSRTVASTVECASALATQSCDDLLSGILLPCQTAGTLQGGELCVSNIQCASRSCQGLEPEQCGSCTRIIDVTADASCAVSGATCPDSYICSASHCVRRLKIGDECGRDDGECNFDLRCAREDGQATGHCVAATVATVDQPCGALRSGNVSCARELYCKMGTGSSGVCKAFAALNDACADYSACGPDAYCAFTAKGVGTCRAGAKAGERCADPVKYDGGSYTVPCAARAECSPDAGVCLDPPGGNGAPCTGPLSSCERAIGLSCTNGKCTPLDSTICGRDAG